VTAPEDPFRSPPPSEGQPGGTPPGGAPPPGTHPYGDQVGSQQPGPSYGGQQSYGTQPYGGQQQYGQPYGGPAFGEHRPAPKNGLGVAALVLGILALLTGLFFVGGVLGIAAVVLGVMGRGRAKRGEATNGGMALAGIVLGVLGILLTALAAFGVASLLSNEEFGNLAECLQDAGNDRALQQECENEFTEGVSG